MIFALEYLRSFCKISLRNRLRQFPQQITVRQYQNFKMSEYLSQDIFYIYLRQFPQQIAVRQYQNFKMSGYLSQDIFYIYLRQFRQQITVRQYQNFKMSGYLSQDIFIFLQCRKICFLLINFIYGNY